jgi:hypothetical protein
MEMNSRVWGVIFMDRTTAQMATAEAIIADGTTAQRTTAQFFVDFLVLGATILIVLTLAHQLVQSILTYPRPLILTLKSSCQYSTLSVN